MRFAKPIRTFFIVSTCAGVALPASAQSAEEQYKQLLTQISETQLILAQKEAFVANQDAQIADLEAQIQSLGDTKAAIPSIIEKMAAAIEREVNSDYPFDLDQRQARIADMKSTVGDEKATPGQKFRKALHVYNIEVNYGGSIEAFQGDHPKNPTIREGDDRFEKDENGKVLVDPKSGLRVPIYDGNYLRYGRTSYVYLNNDGSSPLRYDLEKKDWIPLSSSEGMQVARGIRVAKGEIAPDVIYAPVVPDS